MKLLKQLAVIYHVALSLDRDADDKRIRTAYRKVSAKAHPDHGGDTEHQQELNSAHDAWQDAHKAAKDMHGGSGRRKKPQASPSGDGDAGGLVHNMRAEVDGYRIRGLGVLLTYQKFGDKAVWSSFVPWVQQRLQDWGVKRWSATMETNTDGTYHLHLMVQFHRTGERKADDFVFNDVRPNAQVILGGSWVKTGSGTCENPC